MTQADYTEYLDFAKDLAKQAGDIAREHFKVGVAADKKADNTPVTIADKAINSLVIEKVKAAYPTHDVLGEEESDQTGASEFVWVCDPIDGTSPYSFGLPYSCFMLALVEDGEPMVAVIYDIFSDRLYSATKGGGTLMNGEPVHVNAESDISLSVVSGTGRGNPVIDVPQLQKVITSITHRTLTLMCVGQEALLVANGSIEGGVFVPTTAYDVAAPMLIVREAGGKVTDLLGNDQRYDQPVNGLVYSNGLIHDDLLAAVQESLVS